MGNKGIFKGGYMNPVKKNKAWPIMKECCRKAITLDDISKQLKKMEGRIMASLQEVKDAIAAEKQEVLDGVKALNDQIQALKDQIANGTPVTAADLDEIVSSVHDIFTA